MDPSKSSTPAIKIEQNQLNISGFKYNIDSLELKTNSSGQRYVQAKSGSIVTDLKINELIDALLIHVDQNSLSHAENISGYELLRDKIKHFTQNEVKESSTPLNTKFKHYIRSGLGNYIDDRSGKLEKIDFRLKCIKSVEANALLDNEVGLTKLMALALGKMEDTDLLKFQQLLNDGAIVNATMPGQNLNAAMFLVLNKDFGENHVKALELLIRNGLNVNDKTPQGKNISHYLLCSKNLSEEHLGALQLLVNNGLDINAQDAQGITPAVNLLTNQNFNESHLKAFKLISPKLNMRLKTNDGDTALMMLAKLPKFNEYNYEAFIFALSTFKVDLQATNKDNLSLAYLIKMNPMDKELKNDITELLNKKNPLLSIPADVVHRLKGLAHATSQAGTGELKSNSNELTTKYNLEGGESFIWLKQMAKSTKIIATQEKYASLMPREHAAVLQDALEFNVNGKQPKEIVDRIKSGKPTIIPTGFSGHYCTVLFFTHPEHGPQFLLCNRGALSSNSPIQANNYQPKLLSENMVERIISNYQKAPDDYQKLFFIDLPRELQFQKGDFHKEIEIASRFLPKQTVGNCSYESPVTAVWAILAMQPTTNNPQKTGYGQVNTQFNNWAVLNQAYHFERAIGVHQIRTKNPVTDEKAELQAMATKIVLLAPTALQAMERMQKPQRTPIDAAVQKEINDLEIKFSKLST